MRDNPGAKLKVGIDNFHDAIAAVQRFGDGGTIGHNTTIVVVRESETGDRGVGIRLYGTVIVAYFPGYIRLDSGRHRTVTTKARMNEVLPSWLRVVQDDFKWWVSYNLLSGAAGKAAEIPFEDGMRISVDAETYLPNPMKRPTAKHLRTEAGRRDWGDIEPQEAQAVWDRAMSRRPPVDPRAEFLAEASRKPLGPITHADYLKAIRAPLPGAHLPIPKQYRSNPRTRDLLSHARKLGKAVGEAMATWVDFDSPMQAQRVLQMIDDGDPAIYDSLRGPNLSGEYAGDPTPFALAEELGIESDDERLDDAATAWEDAAMTAFWDAVARAARHAAKG